MNTGLTALSHHPASLGALRPLGVMGVSYGATRPSQDTIHKSIKENASVEGSTIISTSPEPMIDSPPLAQHDHQSPKIDVGGTDSSPHHHQNDGDTTKINGIINISSLMNSNRSVDYHHHHQQLSMASPHHPLVPLPIRSLTVSPTSGGQYNTGVPPLPMTPTTTPPVADISSSHALFASQYLSHMTSTSPLLGLPQPSWHPHVYGPPVKSPSSHSIADILGYKPSGRENLLEKMVSSDEPLNLTTKPSHGDLNSKGKIMIIRILLYKCFFSRLNKYMRNDHCSILDVS